MVVRRMKAQEHERSTPLSPLFFSAGNWNMVCCWDICLSWSGNYMEKWRVSLLFFVILDIYFEIMNIMPPQVMHWPDYINNIILYIFTHLQQCLNLIIMLGCFMVKILIIQINSTVWLCKANILNDYCITYVQNGIR